MAIEGSRGVKLDKHGEFTFEVPGQPATKKNSPVLVMGRAVVLPSKAYKNYEKLFHKHLELLRAKWGALPHFEGPVSLEVKYYLQDRRAYPDLNGLIQATQDILADGTAIRTIPRHSNGNGFSRMTGLLSHWMGAE